MSEIVDCLKFVIEKTCWTFSVFLKFLGLRVLDVFGLILNLASCATIIRLPAMIFGFLHMSTLWEWRYVGFIQLLIFLMDIPFILMGIVLILTVWRLPSCWVELKKNWSGFIGLDSIIMFSGFKIRFVIMKHFITLFLDVFCIPSAIVCLLSWRCVIFINKMKKADNDWERRKVCFTEFMQTLFDFPLIICIMIAACSWRLPFLVFNIRKSVRKGKEWNSYRVIGFYEVMHLLEDIPCIFLFLLTALTWRCPVLACQIVGIWENVFKSTTQRRIRKIIVFQFLYIFVDIPCILATFFLLLSVWRLFSLYRGIKKANKQKKTLTNFYKKEFEMRAVIIKEFGMIFVDLFCFLIFVIIMVTLWRTYPMLKEIKRYFKRYQDATVEHISCVKNTDHIDDEIRISSKESNDEDKNTDNQSGDIILEKDADIDVPMNNSNTVKVFTWSQCTWKIRKSICIHFAMLFLDIPAIPLSVFLLITGLRTTALLSAVLGNGNFYALFAASVYYQMFRFFVDLFFMLLFVILIFLRPIQIWVHLLEDEEHKKNRLLRNLLVWVPDISNDRQKVYEELDEVLVESIKENLSESLVQQTLENSMHKHISRLNCLLEQTKSSEIEDEFCYLLESVIFWEEKRVNKLLRMFFVEQTFILRPDVPLYKDNQHKLNTELREFEEIVSEKYKNLLSYNPDIVPLYETKCGLSLRSRKETRNVLIDSLPRGQFVVLLLGLICCAPLYRAPKMIRKLLKRWYDRYHVITSTLKEYALDILALLRILIVLVCMYRAPFLIAEILECVVDKRSWKAVRNVVKKYPADMCNDLLSLLATFFSWNTPRFIFATILFGILMPADMFLTVTRLCTKKGCVSYLLTAFIYIFIFGFPLVFGLYGAKELLLYGLGWSNIVVLCLFMSFLLGVLSLMVMALVRNRSRAFLVEMPPCDYIRFSWINIHVFLFEFVEFLQTIALIFKLSSIPMYGSNITKEISRYVLFSFFSFDVVFLVSVGMFLIWFFLCAAPVILENILGRLTVGTCGKKASWRLAISLFANTLFVSMVENFVSFSACKYTTCPSHNVLGKIPANSSCITAMFVEDPSYECWSNEHRSYAVAGLICLVWYVSTALVFDTKYGDPDGTEQDIGFSPVYNTGLNILKAIMVVTVSLVTNNQYVVIAVLLFCNFCSILLTVFFRPLFHHEPCNVPSILVWRLFTFLSCIVTIIAVLIAYILNDNSSKVPLLIIVVGIVFVFFVALSAALYLRRESKTEKDRQEFKIEICLLEKRLQKNKWLLSKWKNEEKTWSRLVKNVREAGKNDRHVDPSVWSLPSMKSDNIFANSDHPSVTIDENHIVTEVSENLAVSTEQSFSNDVQTSSTAQPIQQPPNSVLKSEYPKINNVYRLEKNGRNLLAILEKHIRYEGYRYSFILQRHLWLNALWKSDWTGLLECLRILNSNIQGTFHQPTALDLSLSSSSLPADKLEDAIQDEKISPTPFVRQTKQMLEQASADCREKAITDFSLLPNYSTEWSVLMDKILPTQPVIKSWTFYNNASGYTFELLCRRSCVGTITEIDKTKGNKIAQGASFSLGKSLRGHLTNSDLCFEKGFEIVAKKGPVNVTVNTVGFVSKGDVIYIQANGKKVKYDVAIASCKTVQWN